MTILHFNPQQFWPLAASVPLLLASVWCFYTSRMRASLWLLFAGALGLGFFMAALDTFLVLWDEQFHALVAKHKMQHPFTPMLYDSPALDYDYTCWAGNTQKAYCRL